MPTSMQQSEIKISAPIVDFLPSCMPTGEPLWTRGIGGDKKPFWRIGTELQLGKFCVLHLSTFNTGRLTRLCRPEWAWPTPIALSKSSHIHPLSSVLAIGVDLLLLLSASLVNKGMHVSKSISLFATSIIPPSRNCSGFDIVEGSEVFLRRFNPTNALTVFIVSWLSGVLQQALFIGGVGSEVFLGRFNPTEALIVLVTTCITCKLPGLMSFLATKLQAECLRTRVVVALMMGSPLLSFKPLLPSSFRSTLSPNLAVCFTVGNEPSCFEHILRSVSSDLRAFHVNMNSFRHGYFLAFNIFPSSYLATNKIFSRVHKQRSTAGFLLMWLYAIKPFTPISAHFIKA